MPGVRRASLQPFELSPRVEQLRRIASRETIERRNGNVHRGETEPPRRDF